MACLREPCLAPSYWTFGLGCLCAAHREIAWPWPPVKGCKEVKLTQPLPDVCQSRRYLQELNGSYGKESAYNAGDLGFDPLEKEVATHSSILAWKIPWTEEHGGLQSMGSQKVRHDWATDTYKWPIYFVSSPPHPDPDNMVILRHWPAIFSVSWLSSLPYLSTLLLRFIDLSRGEQSDLGLDNNLPWVKDGDPDCREFGSFDWLGKSSCLGFNEVWGVLVSDKWKWKSLSRVQLFVTPWTIQSMEFSRILEWVAFPFSRGSSQPRDRTQVPRFAGGFFTSWATRESHVSDKGA